MHSIPALWKQGRQPSINFSQPGLHSKTLFQEEEVEEEEARMGMKEKGDRREWVGEELSCSRDSV